VNRQEPCVSTDPYRLRTLASMDDYPLVAGLLETAFGEEYNDDDHEYERHTFEPARNHVLEHPDDGVVANAGAYTRELTVPGAILPSAGHVTLVGVVPTHRRRGLLTRLMRHQLADIRDNHHEPVALLWASEGRIYQRFGYGAAVSRLVIEADKRDLRLDRVAPPAGGRLRDAVPGDVRKTLTDVYERVRPTRPGLSGRSEGWWSNRLHDPQSGRHGWTAMKATLYETGDGVDGYALWARKGDWSPSGPAGKVRPLEIVAATPDAYVALWQQLFSVDLTRTVDYAFAPVDDPLRHLVDEPRALNAKLVDSLWLRLVDLPAALAARRYAAPVDVVVEVTDALLPDNAGRWRLTGDLDGAACTATSDPAELRCDVVDLGAAYLGGVSLAALAGVGRVRELRPGALAAAATAFSWPVAPAAYGIF
jgi:predicted acetyltransferase